MTAAFIPPQPCPLCNRGPYSAPESLLNHASSAHPGLSDRERSDLVKLARMEQNGIGPGSRLSLTFRRPQMCPRRGCGWGPYRLHLSLWLHAYARHGYLSLDELGKLMEEALDHADLQH